MKLYRAYLYCVRDGSEHANTILYESDCQAAAVLDALDWYEGRREAIPEHFTPLVAVNIFEFHPQRVKDKFLPPSNGLPFFEWKHDWGLRLPTRQSDG